MENQSADSQDLKKTSLAVLSNQTEEEDTIDLLELFYVLLDKVWYILFVSLLCALILNMYAYFCIAPTYEARSGLYVVSASSGSVVNLSDLNLSNNLKNDYAELITDYPVLDKVIDRLGLEMTHETLQKMVSVTNPSDTRILYLTVTASDPQLACDIANALAEVSVDYLPATMSTDAPNISRYAQVPKMKSGPSLSKYTLLGAALGFALAAAFYVIRHLLDNTIKTEETMEKRLGALPLATVPYIEAFDADRSSLEDGVWVGEAKEHYLKMRVQELPYGMENAMDKLRINIRFSGEQIRKILITSSVPNEGKSHVSFYLWKQLAEAGFKTVLVDADLRNSNNKEVLGLQTEGEMKGLAYYLSGQCTYEEAVYHTAYENGDFIPVANLVQNPISLYESDAFGALFDRLSKEYDYVLIDSAPLLSVADSSYIASLCDASVLVVRSGRVPYEQVIRSASVLEQAGCRVLGTVLNGVHMNHHGYGHYGYGYGRYGRYGHYGRYGKGYGYGYGYGEYGKKQRKKDSKESK